jgi:hypothetical protein
VSETLGPGPRTRVRRLPKKASYDAAVIHQILDEAWVCHVAASVREKPVALPTLHLREGSTIYLHGSPANEVLKAIVRDGEAFVTMTVFDGHRHERLAVTNDCFQYFVRRTAVQVDRAALAQVQRR